MKTFKHFITIAFCFVAISVFSQSSVQSSDARQILKNENKNCFIENKGQWPEQVKFLARLGNMNAWITDEGVVYDYYQIYKRKNAFKQVNMSPVQRQKSETENSRIKGQIVSILSEGSKRRPHVSATGKLKGTYNYIIGNNNVIKFVNRYSEVFIEDIYPGITIRYYFDKGLIRYDYILKQGADLSQINLKISGSDDFLINQNGELSIKTKLGNIFHGKLFAYQKQGSNINKVDCSFAKNENGTVGILTGHYDPTLSLVIDPLVYSTFIGGSDNEVAMAMAVDNSDFAYITGFTESSNFPTITGSYDRTINGYKDIFVTKISTTGTGLEYSTFIGGNGNDVAQSIAVDSNGVAYLTGYTESSNFPITSLAFEVVNKGGSDVFVLMLDATGSKLDYSTYIGGTKDDRGTAIAVDSIGNIYIAGFTESINYPIITGSFNVNNSGYSDVFVTKFDPYYGYLLTYSTYIGGSGYDYANSMTIDHDGNVYITGFTESSNYPTKFGSYDRTFNGAYDAIVTKLDAGGANLVYSTFIGGTLSDYGNAITLDKSGNAIITGYSESTNYPVTSGAYDVSMNGSNDIIVTKLNSAGSALIFSTYIGGSKDEFGYAISLDNSGNTYITGSTNSSNFPVTKGCYDKTYNGYDDAYILKLRSNGSGIIYSSYIGSTDDEAGNSIALDLNENAYITGYTASLNFPTTKGSYDRIHDLGYDVFVTKILPVNQSSTITVSNISASKVTCSWTKGNGTKRAVFVIKSDTGVALPVDFTTYNPNKTFGSGNRIGTTNWYCVYNDTGSTVDIQGLQAQTTYRIMVCDYIGVIGYELYNTDTISDNPINFTTPFQTPSIQAKKIIFSNVTANGFILKCTKGNGAKRVIFIKTGTTFNAIPSNNYSYISDSNFGSGSQIGSTGAYCIYNDTGNTVSVKNLLANTIYGVFAFEYNGTLGKEQYLTDTTSGNPAFQSTIYLTPSVQASNIIVSTKNTNSLSIKWTKGNGAKRVVFVADTNLGIPNLSDNNTYIAVDSFGMGSQIGSSGWYCVYNDTGSTVKINKLNSYTLYRIFVSEYNGTKAKEKYNTTVLTNNPVNQLTNFPTPSAQAKDLVFSGITSTSFKVNWTKGNGIKRVLFITSTNSGTAKPANNITYYANDTFGKGSQIGTTGWYCAYNGVDDSIKIFGLTPITTFRLMVCEYNGTLSGYEQYLTISANNNPINQTTDFAKPDTQASDIVFSNITPTSVIYNYTRGNGSNCIILVTEGTTLIPPLVDNTTYQMSDQIGTSGWYCKYNGNLNPTSLVGLHQATWKMMICEYNGTPGSEKYNTNTSKNNPNSFTNVGINDTKTQKVLIQPNPTKGKFLIENSKGSWLNIYDCTGKIILSDIIKNDKYSVDLKNASDGIYMIRLYNGDQYQYQKIILKK